HYGVDDGDCTTWVLCKCGWLVKEANESHTPEEDDGDCTTPIKCANCDQIVVAGNESHTGGTANRVSGKICEACGVEYDLAKNPENHASDEFTYTDNGDGTHKKIYSCCDEVHTGTEEHDFADDLYCRCGVNRVDINDVNVTPWEDEDKLIEGSIGVYVNSTLGNGYGAENVKWTYNNGEWGLDDTTKVIFGNNGECQQIAAYYPYTAYATNNEVQIILSEAYAADYDQYDYLYGGYAPLNNNPDSITMNHLMAKVTVNVTKGSELDGDEVVSIALTNVPRTVTWTLPGDTLSGYGEGENIELYNNEGAYTGYVLPNEAESITLRITMASGRVFTETVSLDDLTTTDETEVLTSGVHYKLDVKVGKDAFVIDGTLGGDTEVTEDDITALVEQLKYYVDNGITTIIVTGETPAMIDMGNYTATAIGEAIYRLSGSDYYDENNPYNGKIDLILPDVTEIVDWEFSNAYALNSINLPKVTTIGVGAFSGCYYLETLTFGSVVTSIKDSSYSAFTGVGDKTEAGRCNLVLNREQVNAEAEYQPNIETNVWWNTPWKHITLI
ncbi:MAG: fimbrillin family protein, partial [Clostridia bacterium]|nr:fimbrillin family protein [Clostridia bacterium]